MGILAILSLLVISTLSSALRSKGREDARIYVQQNVRAAMKILTEDLRSGGHLRVWNQSACDHSVQNPDQNPTGYTGQGLPCSNHYQIAIVTLTGYQTRVPEPPGNSFTNASETLVCDARPFSAGDLALLYNGSTVELLRITHVQKNQRDYTKPCTGPANPPVNADKVQHNQDKISGTWSEGAYLLRAQLVTYYLDQDPTEPGARALFRRVGWNTSAAAPSLSRLVAFGIVGLKVEYGVPLDPNDPSSKLVFYPTLEQAVANVLGSSYSALPNASGKTYVGNVLRAVRITLTGEKKGRDTARYTLTQMVKFRR